MNTPQNNSDPTLFMEIPGKEGDRIVLYKWNDQPPAFCNLVRINSTGQLIWRVTPLYAQQGVYSGVEIKNGNLSAYNMDGYLDTIDYNTGIIIERVFVK